ncbi:MAG: MBG domain-containing protein [Candidatus Acidiferrales bacterium]
MNPADITQGTSLGDAQLNAKASVPGEFTYVPTAGTLLSAGSGQTLSVTFLPSDDVDYNSASASVVINVKDAALVPLAIAPESVSRPYGQVNPPFTANYNGFINGDTLASLNGFLNCGTTAVPSISVGSYAIGCSGLSSQKYSITFVPGSLTVTAAPLTVSANGATRQFGQANPSFTAAFGGFVNGDTLASLVGTLACSSAATPSGPVSGSPYEITCSGVSSPNYSISFVPGSLTITKTTPLITWTHPADITQGTALGSTQLSAAANVPGTFTYVPPAGTVLSVGTGQTLSATFVATDTVDYISAAASVTINVNPKTQVRGDLNGDGVVDCADLNIVKASFGKKTGQAGFDARGDPNGDGIVNVIDLSAEAKLVPAGTTCK